MATTWQDGAQFAGGSAMSITMKGPWYIAALLTGRTDGPGTVATLMEAIAPTLGGAGSLAGAALQKFSLQPGSQIFAGQGVVDSYRESDPLCTSWDPIADGSNMQLRPSIGVPWRASWTGTFGDD